MGQDTLPGHPVSYVPVLQAGLATVLHSACTPHPACTPYPAPRTLHPTLQGTSSTSKAHAEGASPSPFSHHFPTSLPACGSRC